MAGRVFEVIIGIALICWGVFVRVERKYIPRAFRLPDADPGRLGYYRQDPKENNLEELEVPLIERLWYIGAGVLVVVWGLYRLYELSRPRP